MKIKNVLIIFLLMPIFLTAQSEKVSQEAVFSFYGGIEVQFANFSDVNDQIKTFDIPTLDNGLVALSIGGQINLPNTPFATSIEATFVETCPDDIEEYPTQVLVRGHSVKIQQLATVYQNNDWSFIPSLGVGYQKTTLSINGEYSSDESGQLITTSIDNKSFRSNYFAEVGFGFEKAIAPCGSTDNMLYMGSSINFRKTLGSTVKGSAAENSVINLSDTNFNRPTWDFWIRYDLF